MLLPDHQWYRLISGKRISNHNQSEQLDLPSLNSTAAQKHDWYNAYNPTSTKKYQRQRDLTVNEQLNRLKPYLKPLIKVPRKEQIKIKNELLQKLRDKVSYEALKSETPWVWLLLSWLYSMLKKRR